MKPPPLNPPSEACESCQQQISELSDVGGTPSSALQSHLDGCVVCAQFAALWLPGAPEVLTRPLPVADHAVLRERILRAAAPANVVSFPAAASRTPLYVWLGRVAACVALAGFSYWLLNPTLSPVRSRPAHSSMPTLTQNLRQMENQTRREQQTLQTALVDGGRRVHDDVAWSMSALEL